MMDLPQLKEFHQQLSEGKYLQFRYRRDGGDWRDAVAKSGEPVHVTSGKKKPEDNIYPLMLMNAKKGDALQHQFWYPAN